MAKPNYQYEKRQRELEKKKKKEEKAMKKTSSDGSHAADSPAEQEPGQAPQAPDGSAPTA